MTPGSERPAVRTLLHVFPTLKTGGAQMRFVRLANCFGDAYRHLMVAMDGTADSLALLAPGVDARPISVSGYRKGAPLGNLRACRRLLEALRPDLLVTSNWGSIEWALANLDGRFAHLHMEDGFGPDEAVRQLPRRVWARRLALRRSTVLLPSLTLLGLARDVWRLPRGRLCHVPNGIDCDRFAAAADPAFAASLGLGGEDPVVGTVATLRPEKNLHRLIEAFALAAGDRPGRLAIVGDGPERPALAAHAATLGITGRVVFTGACPAPERLLPRFAIFALSSDTEQMPLSLLEAMAAGRPAAATAVGDVPVMVAEPNRPFVVPPDAGRLAAAIRALLDDPARAAAVGAANRERARTEYDQSRMCAAFRRLFDTLGTPTAPLAAAGAAA